MYVFACIWQSNIYKKNIINKNQFSPVGQVVSASRPQTKFLPLTHLLLCLWILVYGNQLGCHHVHCSCCKHWSIIESGDRWPTYTLHIGSVRLPLNVGKKRFNKCMM